MPTIAGSKPKRVNLVESLYDLLKKDIIECRLQPGEMLQETFVRERYQIGHTPFREACQRLEAEGLIQIIPRRGYFVPSFSNKDIRDLFELRSAVEALAVELACERGNPGGFQALESNLEEFRILIETRPPSLPQEINWNNKAFHTLVGRLSDNLELESAVERIHNKLMRIIMFTTRITPEEQFSNSLHPRIFEALREKKIAEARKWMVKDINVARDWIRDAVRI
jgi:DNA-binding GntR family transcriptional regulator